MSYRAGHERLAHSLRTLGNVLVGADFGAGMTVGTGFMLAHPVGVTIGFGLTIEDNVTFAAECGTAAARHYDADEAKSRRSPPSAMVPSSARTPSW